MNKPTIAFVQGDATGIGPELTAKLLSTAQSLDTARVVVFSDPAVFEAGCEVAGVALNPIELDGLDRLGEESGSLFLHSVPAPGLAEAPRGIANEAAGKAVLECYNLALDACNSRRLDGLCFTPFNKQALHMAGMDTEDETQWARRRVAAANRVSEFNVIDGMWNARVTSHVPLKDVAALLTVDEIVNSIALADRTLRAAGFERPRIAVAALNPHAGDGGAIGREEIEVIAPAVERARERQIQCDGPFPSDTLYIKVRDGQYDCAVSMYHDQGQIAIKLLGFQMGVSVHAGLPFPMATPAHGTAFDIVGKNLANPEPTRRAFNMVATMAASNRQQESG